MSDRGSRPPDAGLAGMRIGLEYGSGQVAYVHPLSAVPEDWLALLRR